MGDKLGATLNWETGVRFSARTQSGYALPVDSPSRPGHQGPSPMELVLVGLAGCTAMDVISILEKMRQPVRSLQVRVEAERAATHPKRFTAAEIVYDLRGEGLSREKAEHAVELSHSTYCSASASLRPDISITSRVLINGE
jgi:putative redox protein